MHPALNNDIVEEELCLGCEYILNADVWCAVLATVLVSRRTCGWILGLPTSQCCSSVPRSNQKVSAFESHMIACWVCLRGSSRLKAARGIWYVFCDKQMNLRAAWAGGICVWEQIVDMNSLRSFVITSACGFNWLNQQIELIRDF